MAEEIIKKFKIDVEGATSSLDEVKQKVDDTGQSFKSMKDFKTYIDKLTASLLDLEAGSEDYKKVLGEIKDAQEKYKQVTDDVKRGNTALEGSYDFLTQKMAALKKAWRATADEGERAALGSQIKDINDQLKGLDAGIGNYQRNVGNYKAAFVEGMKEMKEGIGALSPAMGGMVGNIQNVTKALLKMIATPVGAVIAAVVLAVKGLISAFKGSEEATMTLKRALSAFQPVLDIIQNAFTGLAKLIANVAEVVIPKLVGGLGKAADFIVSALNKIGIVSDETKAKIDEVAASNRKRFEETQAIEAAEQKLTKDKRQRLADEAKTELEISELRSKAASKDIYTTEQRAQFLQSAIDKEKELLQSRLTTAQEEFDVLQRKSQLTDNDAETNNALAQAEANLYNVRREYFSKTKELQGQISEFSLKAQAEISKLIEAGTKGIDLTFEIEEESIDDAKTSLDFLAKAQEDAIKKAQEVIANIRKANNTAVQNLIEKWAQERAIVEQGGKDVSEIDAYYQSLINANTEQSLRDRVQQYAQAAAQISSIILSISGFEQEQIQRRYENGKISKRQAEQEFERTKSAQISATIVQGLAGVANAVSGAMSLGPIIGPVMGAINSALVATTTGIQIAKIAQTSFDSTSTISGSTTPTATSQAYQPTYQTTITGASEADTLSQSIGSQMQAQKVYVVESDIQAVGKRVEVRAAEASF